MLYWFTLLYFAILFIRLVIVGIIFVKSLLLNERMVKFLENLRYFKDEADVATQQSKYPLPETVVIDQLTTLKRLNELSEQASLAVKHLTITLVHQPKHAAEDILQALHSSISKFQSLLTIQLNLE